MIKWGCSCHSVTNEKITQKAKENSALSQLQPFFLLAFYLSLPKISHVYPQKRSKLKKDRSISLQSLES